jgi:hypothetical protein
MTVGQGKDKPVGGNAVTSLNRVGKSEQTLTKTTQG